MQARYIEHVGSDLNVVNAARVSFNKKSAWVCSGCGERDGNWVHDYDYDYYCGSCNLGDDLSLHPDDAKLIKYLAKHNHWTPFAHNSITLHIKVPIFVARQLDKHQVGFVKNEVSRRYVTDEPEGYNPTWRKKSENVKQGSAEEFDEKGQHWLNGGEDYFDMAVNHYNWLLDEGVCPEQARMVLPQSMYTEYYLTGNLYAWSNLYKLRTDSHTQKETQEVAHQIGEIVEPLFPVSWKELTN